MSTSTDQYSRSPEEISSSTSSAKKDSQFLDSCIAISPDDKKIVTFDQKSHEFKLYNVADKSSRKYSFTECGVNDEQLCWSIAISNCIGDGDKRLIALSCFDARKFRNDVMHGDDENGDDVESGGGNKKIEIQKTWVVSISTTDKIEVNDTSLKSIGGVIRFLDSDDSNVQTVKKKIVIIMVNASGIYKETMNLIKESRGVMKKIFKRSSKSKIEKFELPQILSIRLSRELWQSSLELLHTSIVKNHFIVHSFKNRQQIIEMYSLITGKLEMLFKRHESSVVPDIICGSPIFTISQNDKILAFCRGTTSITLYSMENGLEIVTKQVEGQRGIYKIAAIYFIDDDSKLLIVLEETEYLKVEILKRQIFVVWDLFTTFENSIRQVDYYSEKKPPLKMDFTRRLMNSHGNVFAVNDNGDIFSVLNHLDEVSIRNPLEKTMTEFDSMKFKKFENVSSDYMTTNDKFHHVIYTMDGIRCESQIIINNVEPWHQKKDYFRISVFLDSAKRTQLIISENTIQVWKYRTNYSTRKPDKCDRVLEYIWARKKEMNVEKLRVGEREFELGVSWTSSKRNETKTMTIHWPNNVNVLEGACRALFVVEKMKNFTTSPSFENVNQSEYLNTCIQRLVRKYITKYGIFRLTSIRYRIMKYLIKSHQDSLIKHILNKKINRKNSNIYIPRLYEWDEDNKKSTKKSDLYHAIEYIRKKGDPTVILEYLIDYYADNAKEYNHYGWMFTVSEAIPLLYDYKLSKLVRYLFKKPCFGITEAYTPPLNLNPYDQRDENNAIKQKFHDRFSFLKNLFTRTAHNDHIVPLPDFTVYPDHHDPKDPEPNLEDHSENYLKYFRFLFTLFRIFLWPRRKVIKNTKEMSPFLRVIHEEKSYEIYQTPTIMAVLDFKWSAARRYFVRHFVMYLFYAISFGITVIPYSFKGESITILKISLCVYLYTGWYLIVTEIVHLKREGWYRYINIYSIFDLGSLLLPPFVNLASILYDYQVFILQKSAYNSILAFTALVMWLQLLLLLRYFEGPGHFIHIVKSILRTIWLFFVVMLIVVIAFGHAMFILTDYVDDLQIPTYKIKDTSNSDLYSNITIYQNVDKSFRLDNYYSNFVSSVEAVFFWTNGRWDQLNQWDNYAVDVMSLLGSIILVLIFQNMLIAFMNAAFDKANKAGQAVAYTYRAELVAEYEALEKPFNSNSKSDNPRYIYYTPNPTWITETKKVEKQKLHLTSIDSDYSDYDDYDDDNDDDNDDNRDSNDDDDNQENASSSSTMTMDPNKNLLGQDSAESKGKSILSIIDSQDDIVDKGSSSTDENLLKHEIKKQSTTISWDSIKDIIDKISFIDEEIFQLKVTSKLNKKSQRNPGSNKNKFLLDEPGSTNIDAQSLMQERFNTMKSDYKKLKTKIDGLDQTTKKVLDIIEKNFRDSKDA
ncbi:hypothetical protein Glove_139g191 [Diversispora epigaea]|uniref:Ion transport domain-containing protein n=1 Tax=Diversispora epigaea TaxID=1348612 RepID=A0A397J0J2_9GLOM|nr:hypothetical protein Glove_139g191 [Diversispora epigaea]